MEHYPLTEPREEVSGTGCHTIEPPVESRFEVCCVRTPENEMSILKNMIVGGLFPKGRETAACSDNDLTKCVRPYRLNVGCGRNTKEGWINLDSAALPGVNIVCDLDDLRDTPIDLPDNTAEYFLLSHVIEHIRDSLGLMQELWRIAMPGAIAEVRVPHGGSDDAWEDPTHVRPYFSGSFGFFSQPFYWRADYGYRADWQPNKIQLHVDKSRCAGLSPEEILTKVQIERNIVREMVCELHAVKPMREPRRELQSPKQIEIILVE